MRRYRSATLVLYIMDCNLTDEHHSWLSGNQEALPRQQMVLMETLVQFRVSNQGNFLFPRFRPVQTKRQRLLHPMHWSQYRCHIGALNGRRTYSIVTTFIHALRQNKLTLTLT